MIYVFLIDFGFGDFFELVTDGKILTSAQFQLRQQPAIQMRQAPQQFTIFHSRNKQVVVPANVVVSSPPQQQRQIVSYCSRYYIFSLSYENSVT